jgi:hypothetical protein
MASLLDKSLDEIAAERKTVSLRKKFVDSRTNPTDLVAEA